jgi:hypothetical protein
VLKGRINVRIADPRLKHVDPSVATFSLGHISPQLQGLLMHVASIVPKLHGVLSREWEKAIPNSKRNAVNLQGINWKLHSVASCREYGLAGFFENDHDPACSFASAFSQ